MPGRAKPSGGKTQPKLKNRQTQNPLLEQQNDIQPYKHTNGHVDKEIPIRRYRVSDDCLLASVMSSIRTLSKKYITGMNSAASDTNVPFDDPLVFPGFMAGLYDSKLREKPQTLKCLVGFGLG